MDDVSSKAFPTATVPEPGAPEPGAPRPTAPTSTAGSWSAEAGTDSRSFASDGETAGNWAVAHQGAIAASGVGVIDKSVLILNSLELGPQSLSDLVNVTGLTRPTLHRLAASLESHRLVDRDPMGRYRLGPRLLELATAGTQDPVSATAREVLAQLRDTTGESAQLFRRIGDRRVCIAVADRESGLRDTVPIGAELPLTAGSAAQVLLAWEPGPSTEHIVATAAFTPGTLAEVRSRGWAASVGEREAGVASVSAPLIAPSGRVVAALSVSGPIQRLGDQPGLAHAATLCSAALSLAARAFPDA